MATKESSSTRIAERLAKLVVALNTTETTINTTAASLWEVVGQLEGSPELSGAAVNQRPTEDETPETVLSDAIMDFACEITELQVAFNAIGRLNRAEDREGALEDDEIRLLSEHGAALASDLSEKLDQCAMKIRKAKKEKAND